MGVEDLRLGVWGVYGGRGPQARCMGVEDLRLGVWG